MCIPLCIIMGCLLVVPRECSFYYHSFGYKIESREECIRMKTIIISFAMLLLVLTQKINRKTQSEYFFSLHSNVRTRVREVHIRTWLIMEHSLKYMMCSFGRLWASSRYMCAVRDGGQRQRVRCSIPRTGQLQPTEAPLHVCGEKLVGIRGTVPVVGAPGNL